MKTINSADHSNSDASYSTSMYMNSQPRHASWWYQRLNYYKRWDYNSYNNKWDNTVNFPSILTDTKYFDPNDITVLTEIAPILLVLIVSAIITLIICFSDSWTNCRSSWRHHSYSCCCSSTRSDGRCMRFAQWPRHSECKSQTPWSGWSRFHG